MGASPSPVDSVDPFIDTAKPRIRWVFTAFTARPFGMVRLGPNTDPVGTWDAGYRYGSSRIQCFSHIHSWQLAGIPVMPTIASLSHGTGFEAHGCGFSHASERAGPGYYGVYLDDSSVQVDLTATERVGFHRYRFDKGDRGSLVFNLGHELGPCAMSDARVRRTADGGIEGYVENETTRRRNRRCRIHFVVVLDRVPIMWELCDAQGGRTADVQLEGAGIGAAVHVDLRTGRAIQMKVGISYVSVEQARLNLTHEAPHWDFERVRAESREVWDRMLSRVRVEGGTADQRVKFYTDLWRTLVGGHLTSDVDGSYCDLTGDHPVTRRIPRGSGSAPAYPHITGQDGFWNAQWSLGLLYPLVYPRFMSHSCNFLVDMYTNGGLIPRGPSATSYTYVMISAPTTPFLVAAYTKGIRTFDVTAAYDGMRKNAFPGGLMSKAGYEFDTCEGGGIEHYMERGYIPEGRHASGAFHVDGAAQTLECAYQDWALSVLAEALGKEADAALFARRARNYRHLFDKQTGFMRPRRLDGSWLEPFDPLSLTGFCEANSWQYTWHVPQDLPGLMRLMGGRAKCAERLDKAFREAQAYDFYAPKPDLHRDAVVINYGNEPGRYVAHVFNHAGAPWLAQKWARAVRDQTFGSVDPLGFFEDDDQGKAAATSLLLSLGLFDVRGGVSPDPVYELTAPLFDTITIALDPDYYPGGTFTIETRNNAAGHVYLQGAWWNGAPLPGPWIRHRDVIAGGTLTLELGPDPNRSWGTRLSDAPP